MPLRSVEAASRDDAIAAAREQFGPSARVVGVRRVRSGGVLGFFATERYVAEVAADPFARPAASSAGGSTPSPVETTGGFASSPLSAAAAATAAPSSVGGTGRAVAPARNGAAAYAAAGQTPSDRPAATRSSARSGEQSARSAAPAARPLPREDDRVSELAGLFADAPADPPVALYRSGSRTATPLAPLATPSGRDAVLPVDAAEQPRPAPGRVGLAAALDPAAFSPGAPSPFTAALARMAAGDRDVRDAVEVALDQPRVVRGRSTAESWPSRSGSLRSDDSSAPSGTTRQEEEPVGEQVVAPPSIVAPHSRELPNWAAEPAPVMGSPREEAIAEVLRSALAQGHSDEALAGILRKMLAGASPQTALADPTAGSLFQSAVVPSTTPAPPAPVAPVAPVAPEAAPMTMSPAMALVSAGSAVQPAGEATPDPAVHTAAAEAFTASEPSMFEAALDTRPATADASPEETTAESGTDETMTEFDHAATDDEIDAYEMAAFEVPAYEANPYEPPAYRVPSYRTPAYESPLFDSPLFGRPASDNTSMWGPSVASIWGEPTSSHVPLWGEPASFAGASAYQADVPIWDDVLSGIPSEEVAARPLDVLGTDGVFGSATEPADAPEPIEAAAPAADADAEFETVPSTAATAGEITAAIEDDVLEAGLSEVEVAVMAPVFARTASDPAPLSLDATSVMPPLSLLPPLPGSRGGRGRPPVPPAAPRSSTRTTTFSTSRSSSQEPSLPAADTELAAGLESATPAAGEPQAAGSPLATVTRLHLAPPVEVTEAPAIDLFEELDTPAAPTAPTAAAAAAPAPQPELPAGSDTVTSALAALGLPSTVLGETFAGDVDMIGTYAALTRALGTGLPAVPELPTGAGEVLFVVGPGVETLRAARTLAAGLRLDPESVQWATRGDLAGLAPRDSRMTTVDAARQRRQSTADAGTVTIVAVDVPLRTDASWMAQMMAIWSPVAVWAVVEATRKPEDLEPWLTGLTTVDALIVTDTDLSGEPAAALRRADTPVAFVDGAHATPHRWASLLCERLETRRT